WVFSAFHDGGDDAAGSGCPLRIRLVSRIPLPKWRSSSGVGSWIRIRAEDRATDERPCLCGLDCVDRRGVCARLLRSRGVSTTMTTLEPPRHRVEGLGSAHSGVQQFWRLRVSGAALGFLSIWFAYAALGLVGANLVSVLAFLQHPLNAVL